MTLPIIHDVVYVSDKHNPLLSFVVDGDPFVQQRPKITYKGKNKPIYYDPSSYDKKLWRKLLTIALKEVGITSFPVFKKTDTDQLFSSGLEIEVNFYFKRRANDFTKVKDTLVLKQDHQLYPGTKDIDNMLKFVMDAAHELIYDDDKCIVNVIATKRFVDRHDQSAYSFIRIKKC